MDFPDNLVQAAKAAKGIGSGSIGPLNRGANSTIFSDPQRPHRRCVEVETVSQLSQYTAFSTGMEISPGSFRIMRTLRIGPPALVECFMEESGGATGCRLLQFRD